jgi:hypothetical protein
VGLFDKVEKGLERAVNSAFAKAFKAEVQPVEIASAIRRAMDDRATVLGHGRTMVPNVYAIELSTSDFGRLNEYADALSDELVAAAQEHAETQRYIPGGPVQVMLSEGADLETGVFRVRPSTSRRSDSGMPPAPVAGARPAPSPAESSPQPPAGVAVPDPGSDPDEVVLLPDRALAPGQPGAVHSRPRIGKPPAAEPAAVGSPPAIAEAAAAVGGDAAVGGVAAVGGAVAVGGAPAPAHAGSPPAPIPRPRRPTTTRPVARPWLEIDGERYPLLGPLTVIGRDPSADIILDDPGISRRHSEIRVTNDGPHLVTSIRDLASTNGTFVNGERVATIRLEDGDRLTIGRTAMTFRAGKR